MPNFIEGNSVLVARKHFNASEKLCFCWRGPYRIVKAINDYIWKFEDLRDEKIDEVHVLWLKFFQDATLNTDLIMSHVLCFGIGVTLHYLVCLVDTHSDIEVKVRWMVFSDSKDTLKPITQIYKDVRQLLFKLQRRKNISLYLSSKTKQNLGLFSKNVILFSLQFDPVSLFTLFAICTPTSFVDVITALPGHLCCHL